jgi:hypothetical protein
MLSLVAGMTGMHHFSQLSLVEMESLFTWGCPQAMILPISASQAVRITGVIKLHILIDFYIMYTLETITIIKIANMPGISRAPWESCPSSPLPPFCTFCHFRLIFII